MSIRNRVLAAAVAIGALGIAGPVAATSADTGQAGFPVALPVIPASPTLVGCVATPNPGQAGTIAAQGAAAAGAQGAAAGAQAGVTETQTGNPFLAGAQAALGGFQAGATAAQAGFTAGAVALGIPVPGVNAPAGCL
jgi:hypothetical protein